MTDLPKTADEWKDKLTPEQYHIMREGGTESPFTGSLVHNKKTGMYHCAGCGAVLFSSDTKFDSQTGWPSFYDMENKENIELKEDSTLGMVRTEVRCKTCGSHLGHVFDDGPEPTGLRYCINSAALEFREKNGK